MRSLLLPVLCAFVLTACDDKAEASPKAKDDKSAAKDGDKPATAEAPKEKEPVAAASKSTVVNVPLGDGDLQKVLSEHTALAKAAGQKPFVELWATWCPPCKALEASMGDPQIQKAFAGVYLIRLDSDVWSEKLKGSGLDNSTIPVFYELDEAAKPTGRSIDGGAWGEDIPENMAPPLDAFFHDTPKS